MTVHRPAPARAFTLVELLVVIAIIAIIATIALVVGSRVAAGGKVRATESILATLETVFESYQSQSQSAAPSLFTLRQPSAAGSVTFPIFDGRDNRPPGSRSYDVDNDPAQPSLTLFLLAAAEKIELDPLLKSIDSAFIERRTVNAFGWVNNAGAAQLQPVTGLVIKDGFGQPIRYVHPAFHGGAGNFFLSESGGPTNRPARTIRDTTPGSTALELQISRSARPFGPATSVRTVADADEGLCVAGRPYFYSAGPDKNPGTRDDNLYSTRPTFPTETANINAN